MSPTLALVLFAVISMAALMIEIIYTYVSRGFGYGFSSNRPMIERTPLGLRIQRSYQNQVVSGAYIVPALVAASFLEIQEPGVLFASALIVGGRAAFVLLYYTGIPFVRILGFTCGSLGSLYIAYRVLHSLYA